MIMFHLDEMRQVMLMFDATETWRAVLPLRVLVGTLLEGTVRAEWRRDIPRKSIRVSYSKSAALSFLFLSRVMILLPVGAACSDTFGTAISWITRWVVAARFRDRRSFTPAVEIPLMRKVPAAHLQIRSTL